MTEATTFVLDGLRVVSIAQNVPGPMAVSRLVQAGAKAVKVEPTAGDPFIPLCASWYDEMHAGVTVERLDLKTVAGNGRLYALLGAADVFITSHRPSALARLGLDPDTVQRALPDLRVLRILGSLADPEEAGHDLTYQAHAGLLRDGMPLTLAADIMASESVYAGVLELMRRPPGARLDVGLVDSLESLMAPLRHGLTAPGGTLGGGAFRYGVYATKVGSVAVAALEPHFEARLYEQLALAPGTNPAPTFLTRTAVEWEDWGRERDLPIVALRQPKA